MARHNESGRTAVETAATLAVVVVVAVAAIWAFKAALYSHITNQTTDRLTKCASDIVFQKSQTHELPTSFIDEDGVYPIKLDKNNVIPQTFTLIVSGVSEPVCKRLKALDWPLPKITMPDTCQSTNSMYFQFNDDLSNHRDDKMGLVKIDCNSFQPDECNLSCDKGIVTYAAIGTPCHQSNFSFCDGNGTCYDTDQVSGCQQTKELCSYSTNPLCVWDEDGCRTTSHADGGACKNAKTAELCLKNEGQCVWDSTQNTCLFPNPTSLENPEYCKREGYVWCDSTNTCTKTEDCPDLAATRPYTISQEVHSHEDSYDAFCPTGYHWAKLADIQKDFHCGPCANIGRWAFSQNVWLATCTSDGQNPVLCHESNQAFVIGPNGTFSVQNTTNVLPLLCVKD